MSIPVIIIPEGTLIKVSYDGAVAAFIKLAKQYEKDLTMQAIGQALGKINELATAFNERKTYDKFAQDEKEKRDFLETHKELKTPEVAWHQHCIEKAEYEFRREFLKLLSIPYRAEDGNGVTDEEFDLAFYAMCTVDQDAEKIGNALKEAQVQKKCIVKRYSATNSIHERLRAKNQALINIYGAEEIPTTCKSGLTKHELVAKIIDHCQSEEDLGNEYVVVIDNTDKITEQLLRDSLEKKNQAVADVAAQQKASVYKLAGPRLTTDDLAAILKMGHDLASATAKAAPSNQAIQMAKIGVELAGFVDPRLDPREPEAAADMADLHISPAGMAAARAASAAPGPAVAASNNLTSPKG